MAKKKINNTFYNVGYYRYVRAPGGEHQYEYNEDKNGYLFSGWRTGKKTKIKPEDLPPDYIKVTNYKKDGYIKTSNVSDVYYEPSKFHNHTFKDDFLLIAYGDNKLPKDSFTMNLTICDEYIFGNDIIDVVAGIEKYNPQNEQLQERIKKIKEDMVVQYNLYVDEMEESGFQHSDKIKSFDELL